MNEGVNIHSKSVTAQVFTVLIVEPVNTIEKSKGSTEESPSIRSPYVTVTYKSPVIYYYFLSYFFFSSTLQSHV